MAGLRNCLGSRLSLPDFLTYAIPLFGSRHSRIAHEFAAKMLAIRCRAIFAINSEAFAHMSTLPGALWFRLGLPRLRNICRLANKHRTLSRRALIRPRFARPPSPVNGRRKSRPLLPFPRQPPIKINNRRAVVLRKTQFRHRPHQRVDSIWRKPRHAAVELRRHQAHLVL